jgi:hypothetical protein
MAQDKEWLRAFVNTLMNYVFHKARKNFLSSRATAGPFLGLLSMELGLPLNAELNLKHISVRLATRRNNRTGENISTNV